MKLRGLSSAVKLGSIGASLRSGRPSFTRVLNATDWSETCRQPSLMTAVVDRLSIWIFGNYFNCHLCQSDFSINPYQRCCSRFVSRGSHKCYPKASVPAFQLTAFRPLRLAIGRAAILMMNSVREGTEQGIVFSFGTSMVVTFLSNGSSWSKFVSLQTHDLKPTAKVSSQNFIRQFQHPDRCSLLATTFQMVLKSHYGSCLMFGHWLQCDDEQVCCDCRPNDD